MLPKSKVLHYALIAASVALWIVAWLVASKDALRGLGVSATVLAALANLEVILENAVKKLGAGGAVLLLVFGGLVLAGCGGPCRDAKSPAYGSAKCVAERAVIDCAEAAARPAAIEAGLEVVQIVGGKKSAAEAGNDLIALGATKGAEFVGCALKDMAASLATVRVFHDGPPPGEIVESQLAAWQRRNAMVAVTFMPANMPPVTP